MALVKWEPQTREVEPFRGLREEVDRLFDEFLQGSPLGRMGRMFAPTQTGFVPSLDLEETTDEFIVRAEVPGMRKDDLDVNITERQVTIKGERKEERKAKDTAFYRRETLYGAFSRTIDLPAGIVPEKVGAKLENGMLTLILPKAQPSKHKVIKVKLE